MSSPTITPGRALILLANLSYAIGAFIADWNETHVKNPKWPPHARFHNGQTMSLGTLLCLVSSYVLLRPSVDARAARQDVWTASLIASLYCTAGLSAIWYPGAMWMDPEFGEGKPQVPLFTGIVGVVWVGWVLERRRLGGEKVKGA
jgi:hypothetical protein